MWPFNRKRKRYIIQRQDSGLYASATPGLDPWVQLEEAKRFKHKSTAYEVATVLSIMILGVHCVVMKEIK